MASPVQKGLVTIHLGRSHDHLKPSSLLPMTSGRRERQKRGQQLVESGRRTLAINIGVSIQARENRTRRHFGEKSVSELCIWVLQPQPRLSQKLALRQKPPGVAAHLMPETNTRIPVLCQMVSCPQIVLQKDRMCFQSLLQEQHYQLALNSSRGLSYVQWPGTSPCPIALITLTSVLAGMLKWSPVGLQSKGGLVREAIPGTGPYISLLQLPNLLTTNKWSTAVLVPKCSRLYM